MKGDRDCLTRRKWIILISLLRFVLFLIVDYFVNILSANILHPIRRDLHNIRLDVQWRYLFFIIFIFIVLLSPYFRFLHLILNFNTTRSLDSLLLSRLNHLLPANIPFLLLLCPYLLVLFRLIRINKVYLIEVCFTLFGYLDGLSLSQPISPIQALLKH